MKLNNGLNALLASIALLFVLPAHAAWYQVEVVVFNYLSPEFDGELWYENPGLPDRSNSIELITELADNEEIHAISSPAENKNREILPGKAELIPYLQLSDDKLRLDGVQRVLLLSRDYRPLLHVAWQQPGLSATNARAVHIQKFEEIAESSTQDLLAQEPDDLDALRNEPLTSDDVIQVLDLIFDGTIRLRSSSFLHVDVDIAYFPTFSSKKNELDNESSGTFVQQQADYVRLRESRKIRLNEIHYFDHPMFGVILRVSRLNLN